MSKQCSWLDLCVPSNVHIPVVLHLVLRFSLLSLGVAMLGLVLLTRGGAPGRGYVRLGLVLLALWVTGTMDLDDDARTEASSSCNLPWLMMTPLILTIQIFCDLCGKGSQSKSPFLESTQDDRYAGYLPWHRYRRSPCLTGRVCRDKVCLVCFNVFSFSPLKLKHKTWKAFVSAMRDTPAEGVTFRKSCARYIENINRGTDYISILNNHSMKSKPIEIVSEDLFVFF